MDREQILQMAQESGMFAHKEVQPEILRFAELIAAAERERCAKVCDKMAIEAHFVEEQSACEDCAEAIRAIKR